MARSFNGTSDLIQVSGAAFDPTSGAFSVSLWVSNGSVTNALRSFFTFASTSSASPFFLIGQSTTDRTKVLVEIRDIANIVRLNYASTAAPFSDTSLHSIVYTQTGTSAYQIGLYIDGVKETTSYSVGANSVTVNAAAIGAVLRSSAVNFWKGNIAEAALFGRVLTDAEAASLASGLPASHLGPDHYWPLWGADSPEPDLGNVAHVTGTLTGTAAVAGGKVAPNILVVA